MHSVHVSDGDTRMQVRCLAYRGSVYWTHLQNATVNVRLLRTIYLMDVCRHCSAKCYNRETYDRHYLNFLFTKFTNIDLMIVFVSLYIKFNKLIHRVY